MRLLRGRSRKEEELVLGVDAKDEVPYCLDSPASAVVSGLSKSSSSSSEDESSLSSESSEESESTEETPGVEEREEVQDTAISAEHLVEPKSPVPHILVPSNKFTHSRSLQDPPLSPESQMARSTSLYSASSTSKMRNHKRSFTSPFKKLLSPRKSRGRVVLSPPETPRPGSGKEYAEALGNELEQMGYNLDCESFITRSKDDDESDLDERYHLSFDENDDQVGEERDGPPAEKSGDLIESMRARNSPITSPSKKGVDASDEADTAYRASPTWETAYEDGTTTSAATNTSAKLTSGGGSFLDLESIQDIQLTSSAVHTAAGLSSKAKRKDKKKQVYRPPPDILRSPLPGMKYSPMKSNGRQRALKQDPKPPVEKQEDEEIPLWHKLLMTPSPRATSRASPLLLNEQATKEFDFKAPVSPEKPQSRKVPRRRRFMAPGASEGQSSSQNSSESPEGKPMTPRDYESRRPPSNANTYRQRLSKITADRKAVEDGPLDKKEQSTGSVGKASSSTAPKRVLKAPTPAGRVLQGVQETTTEEENGQDPKDNTPVFIEGLSFLEGLNPVTHTQNKESTPMELRNSAEDEDLTHSETEQNSKESNRRVRTWFPTPVRSKLPEPVEDDISEPEFIFSEFDDDQDVVEIIPTPTSSPRRNRGTVLRLFSPRKNWEKKKEFQKGKTGNAHQGFTGIRESNQKRHFACPTPNNKWSPRKSCTTLEKDTKAAFDYEDENAQDENALLSPSNNKAVDELLGGMRQFGALFRGDESLLTMDNTMMTANEGNDVVAKQTDEERGAPMAMETGTLTSQSRASGSTRLERFEMEIKEATSEEKKKKKGGLMGLFRRKPKESNGIKVSFEASKPPQKTKTILQGAKSMFQRGAEGSNKETASSVPSASENMAAATAVPLDKVDGVKDISPGDLSPQHLQPMSLHDSNKTEPLARESAHENKDLSMVETASSDQLYMVVEQKGKLVETATSPVRFPSPRSPVKEQPSNTNMESDPPSLSPLHQRSPSAVSQVHPRSPPNFVQFPPKDTELEEATMGQRLEEFFSYLFNTRPHLTSPEQRTIGCSAIANDNQRSGLLPFAQCGAERMPKDVGFEVMRTEDVASLGCHNLRGVKREPSFDAERASPKHGFSLGCSGMNSRPSPKLARPMLAADASSEDSIAVAAAEPLPPPTSKSIRITHSRKPGTTKSYRSKSTRHSQTSRTSKPTLMVPQEETEVVRNGSSLTSLPKDGKKELGRPPRYPGKPRHLAHNEGIELVTGSDSADEKSENAWAHIADAAMVVEKALNRIESVNSGESADPERLLQRLISVGSSDSAVVNDLENALAVLKSNAARLGVRESDLLLAVKSDDYGSVGEESSIRTLTFTEEIVDAFNMIKKTPKRKKRRS